MAAKKKSAKKAPDIKKALAGMDKAARDLQLHIKALKAAVGPRGHFHPGAGHFGSAAGHFGPGTTAGPFGAKAR